MDLDQPELVAARVQDVNRLPDGFGTGSHQHEHPLGIVRTEILEQPVGPTRQGSETLHRRLDRRGDCRVERVHGFAALEIHVRVLRHAANHRPIRIERTAAMGEHQLVVQHRVQHVIREQVDLGDFMGRPEAIEEVDEWNPCGQRGALRDQREVVRLLDGTGAEHRPAGHPGSHDIGVIAEDRERLRRQGPCRHVEHGRRQLPGDLEHVRDHQQQALGGGERGGQRARLQRAVNRPGGAALALHLEDERHRPPNVRLALGGPLIRQLAHRR